MTHLPSRLSLCASLLLATGAAPVLAQTPDSSSRPRTLVLAAAADLPDAPSSSLAFAVPRQQPQQPSTQQPQAPTPPPPNETPEQKKAREQREEAEREVREEEKQRFGGVVPQFNVVVSGQAVPLTPAQKFDISLHTLKDPYTIGLAFIVGGGIGELNGSHPGYHWGPSGLFKRIGASYADNAIGNIIGNATLPVLLHQDPRYFRKGTGSIKSRIFYSAMTSFICKGDNGKTQFNVSNVLGNFISGAISNAYYPSDERGLGLTIENGTTVTLEGMVGAQLLEFAPDLTNLVHKRREHHRQVLAARAAAAGNSSAPAAPAAVPPDSKTAPPPASSSPATPPPPPPLD